MAETFVRHEMGCPEALAEDEAKRAAALRLTGPARAKLVAGLAAVRRDVVAEGVSDAELYAAAPGIYQIGHELRGMRDAAVAVARRVAFSNGPEHELVLREAVKTRAREELLRDPPIPNFGDRPARPGDAYAEHAVVAVLSWFDRACSRLDHFADTCAKLPYAEVERLAEHFASVDFVPRGIQPLVQRWEHVRRTGQTGHTYTVRLAIAAADLKTSHVEHSKEGM